MLTHRIPDWLRHAPTPGLRGFAVLAGLDATVRGILISVWPLVMYRALGDAALVSQVYFAIGLSSLAVALMVPWLGRFVPRRWLYTGGTVLYIIGGGLGIAGGPWLTALALATTTAGTVIVFVCFNAYVMDFIARSDLGRGETLKLFYSALSWTAGPVLGVWLLRLWTPLPFLVAIGSALVLLAVFWIMRLGNGRHISRARGPAPNPLAYLGRFIAQPRLIAGWFIAVLRACGWWIYVVYLPIFCVEQGLGDQAGGIALSASNGILFLAPLMLRWTQRGSVRRAVRLGFAGSGVLFVLAGALGAWPPLAVGALFAASAFLVLLDMCAGLPFLMAVKPSERTEMSAVYSSFRDVSGIVTPGVASLVLIAAPVAGVFTVGGLGLLAGWALAGRLHPRLGRNGLAARQSSPRAIR